MAKKKTLAEKIEANRKRMRGTADCNALALRISLAQVVFRVLKEGGATMEELAKASPGLTRQMVYRICMADENVSVRDIGTIGWALGVDIHLVARQ